MVEVEGNETSVGGNRGGCAVILLFRQNWNSTLFKIFFICTKSREGKRQRTVKNGSYIQVGCKLLASHVESADGAYLLL